MAVTARRIRCSPSAIALAILFYLAFALFPLYWLLKISVTPEQLLYTEGIRAVAVARRRFDNFDFGDLARRDFPRFFRNSLIVSLADGRRSPPSSPPPRAMRFSRFTFRGQQGWSSR